MQSQTWINAEDELFSHQRGIYNGEDKYVDHPRLVESEVARYRAEVAAGAYPDCYPHRKATYRTKPPIVRKWKKPLVEKLKEWIRGGKSNAEIAVEFKMNPISIRSAIHKHARDVAKCYRHTYEGKE